MKKLSLFAKLWIISFSLLVVAMVFLGIMTTIDADLALIGVAFTILFLVLGIIFLCVDTAQSLKKEREEKQRQWEALPPEEKARLELEKEQERMAKLRATAIEKTRIIGQDTRKSATSSVIRGAVGGALFGLAGVAGGAMSGKNTQSIIFLVAYKDGHTETKTVKINSEEYNKYIMFLEK